VLLCETRSFNARRHNDLEGHSNFLSTIYSYSILYLEVGTSLLWRSTVAFTYLKLNPPSAFVYFRWSWSWSCHFGLGLVSSGLGLGHVTLVLVLRIWSHHWILHKQQQQPTSNNSQLWLLHFQQQFIVYLNQQPVTITKHAFWIYSYKSWFGKAFAQPLWNHEFTTTECARVSPI